MTINELYNVASDLPQSLKYHNKYTWLISNSIIDGKYFDINNTFTNKTPINDYVKRVGPVILIPNIVNGWMVDLVIKPLNTKESVLTFDFKHLPFGIGSFREDFKFGDPIYLVEGIADWAALKLIKPDLDIIAIRSNSIPHDMYSLYASLTDKIVLIPDNDSAGQAQINNIKKNFKTNDTSVYTIEQFGSMKDTGEIIDLLITIDKTHNQNSKELLGLIKLYFLENFKNFSNF